MEIWKVNPDDPDFGTDPRKFKKRMQQIKYMLNICAAKDIYPESHFDSVRWMLVSYLISENFERYGASVPQFADGKRLHASGCYNFYQKMVEKGDPTVKRWHELRKDDEAFVEMMHYLGLKRHLPAKLWQAV